MSKSRIAILVVAVSLIICVLSLPGFAADSKSGAQVFASVDINKILTGYDKSKQIDDQLGGLQASLKQRLQLRLNNRMLTDGEYKQLADLKALPTASADDTKKINELLDRSATLEKEFQALQQKPNASDAEKARMAELQAQADKSNANGKEDEAAFSDQLQKKQEELVSGLKKDVENAVSAVAKEKGVTMVFSKSIAQYDFVIFSNNDISDDVLKKLNKK